MSRGGFDNLLYQTLKWNEIIEVICISLNKSGLFKHCKWYNLLIMS